MIAMRKAFDGIVPALRKQLPSWMERGWRDLPMNARAAWSAPALALLAGCQNPVETANEATDITNAYLANMQFVADMNNIEAVDMGNNWRIAYNFPEGSTGGPVIVIVRKRNGEVVHMETEQ